MPFRLATLCQAVAAALYKRCFHEPAPGHAPLSRPGTQFIADADEYSAVPPAATLATKWPDKNDD